MPFNRRRYPPDWPAIRQSILTRAGHRCEFCRVPNYAVGHRDKEGRFWPAAGNTIHDEAGQGLLSYAEAREIVRHHNQWGLGMGPEGERGIVIVLTISHLNHDVTDNRPGNLRALCQACHFRYDQAMHQRVRKWRREKRAPRLPLEER